MTAGLRNTTSNDDGYGSLKLGHLGAGSWEGAGGGLLNEGILDGLDESLEESEGGAGLGSGSPPPKRGTSIDAGLDRMGGGGGGGGGGGAPRSTLPSRSPDSAGGSVDGAATGSGVSADPGPPRLARRPSKTRRPSVIALSVASGVASKASTVIEAGGDLVASKAEGLAGIINPKNQQIRQNQQAARAQSAEDAQMVSKIFELCDHDRDGFLDYKELEALAHRTAGTLNAEDYIALCAVIGAEPLTGLAEADLLKVYAELGWGDVRDDFKKLKLVLPVDAAAAGGAAAAVTQMTDAEEEAAALKDLETRQEEAAAAAERAESLMELLDEFEGGSECGGSDAGSVSASPAVTSELNLSPTSSGDVGGGGAAAAGGIKMSPLPVAGSSMDGDISPLSGRGSLTFQAAEPFRDTLHGSASGGGGGGGGSGSVTSKDGEVSKLETRMRLDSYGRLTSDSPGGNSSGRPSRTNSQVSFKQSGPGSVSSRRSRSSRGSHRSAGSGRSGRTRSSRSSGTSRHSSRRERGSGRPGSPLYNPRRSQDRNDHADEAFAWDSDAWSSSEDEEGEDAGGDGGVAKTALTLVPAATHVTSDEKSGGGGGGAAKQVDPAELLSRVEALLGRQPVAVEEAVALYQEYILCEASLKQGAAGVAEELRNAAAVLTSCMYSAS